MKTGSKRSRQREAILEYIKSTKEHPSADMVYEHVRKEIPNISLGTVYRNLNLLAEANEIRKVNCDGKSDRFDCVSEPHYHVLCTKCGCVMDLKMDSLAHIDILADNTFEGKITGHSIFFKGICKKCLKGVDTEK
ncbi:MAG: transcriptional repressor [Lachnospiraceae bacterium]|nr:transcriptional repressor [Lachnospiraceae bacterium]